MAPAILIPVAIGLAAASTAVSTASKVAEAKQAAEQAETEAEFIEFEGAAAERKSRQESGRAQASARAQIGASGAGLEGSPIEILAENARQAELEALNIRYTTQAQVAARKQEAKFAKKTILPTIIGGILSFGGQAASMGAKTGIGTKTGTGTATSAGVSNPKTSINPSTGLLSQIK